MKDNGHRLRTTPPVVLAVTGIVTLAIGGSIRPLVERAGGVPPPVTWFAPFTLAVFGAVVGYLAWTTYRTIHQRRLPVEPHRAVSLLVLAKASALAGAAVAGAYLGYALSFADALDAALPRDRVIRSTLAGVLALCVMVAGLLLERACRVPGEGDDEDEPTAGTGGVASQRHGP